MLEKIIAAAPIEVGTASRLISVTERHIQRLASAGRIKKPYTIAGVIRGYLKSRDAEDRSSTKTAGEEEIRRERARKLKLANDETERDTMRVDDAIAVVDEAFGQIQAVFAGVAVRASDDLSVRRKIEDGIDAALAELAQRCEKARSALVSDRDVLEAGAESDAEPLGEDE